MRFQEINREGWIHALRRVRIEGDILRTRPLRTARQGKLEVRLLTWRRDWINSIWALKSFYYYAGVDYPLRIHDGGLLNGQAAALREHFPDAEIITAQEGDRRVEAILRERDLQRCLAYRRRNVATRKLFDFFLLSQADRIITIDSDIFFFQRPQRLLAGVGQKKNLYLEDGAYFYSMSLDELETAFGIRPPPRINSGLSLVARSSIDFPSIEEYLKNTRLAADTWVTEQTLHALCAARFGVELLPGSYRISDQAGIAADMVCKSYAGTARTLLCEEGMPALKSRGLLEKFGLAKSEDNE